MKTGEKVSHLEITEVVLVHCNLVDNSNKIQKIQLNHLVNYYRFHQNNYIFKDILIRSFQTLKYDLQIKVLNR